MSDETCRCGHDRDAHYVYILNGRDQSRCKLCDPWRGIRGGGDLYAVEDGGRFQQADRAADHDFEPTNASSN